MKKFFSAISAFLMFIIFSVTAFAGAPSLFSCEEGFDSIICTGGEGRVFVIIAIVAAALALVGGVIFFITGKKK